MSIQPAPIDPVPDETIRVARAAFPGGNPYLTLRDQLGDIFQDDHFADLYPGTGKSGLSPWRLAWVTILQFRETLSDRQAAEAVRARIDWKYLLGLDLTDCGFDFSVLSEFRGRLLAGNAPARLLDQLLARCQSLIHKSSGGDIRRMSQVLVPSDPSHHEAASGQLHPG